MASSFTGYYYSDDVSPTDPNNIQTHLVNNNQIQQSFEFNNNPAEIYNLTPGMDMIGFPPKNLQQSGHQSNSVIWKGFLGSGGGGKPNNHHHSSGPPASSSKTINESHDFYDHQQNEFNMSDTDSVAAWHENRLQMVVDDPSLRCVFPCEGNERPSHGLSLSLSSTNPSTVRLQSFELRQQDDDTLRFPPPHTSSSRDGLLGKSINIQHYQQMVQDDHGLLGKDANLQYYRGQLVQIRNSQYLGPAQELLNEFCSLVTKQIGHNKPKTMARKTNQQCLGDNASSSSSKQPLHSLELLELQKRRAKLFQMLDEVDRRYKHYRDQMKVVVSSFEAVAGNGAATVYSSLASKAMSKHFRCLRDGISAQIKALEKAMGENSAAAPGATHGETPRLKILDQTLRQQKSFQQINMLESHPWRPQRGLPERSVSILRAWLFEHFLHPYPTDVDKHILARQTGLSRSQVSNWFINARVRLWKPMVEEMYLEEKKEEEQQENNMHMSSSDEPTATAAATSTVLHYDDHDINGGRRQNQKQSTHLQIDQKPTTEQLILLRINDSESLSSIVNNNPEKNNNQHGSTVGGLDSFDTPVDLDFSTYNIHRHHPTLGGPTGYSGGGGRGGGAVSLTLGLQQHGGNRVSLALSPTSQQASLFYHRDQMEDCQPIQYSILDGEGQSLPYRNLMGAQLLHDFAG